MLQEVETASEEIGGYVLILAYGLMLLGAIRIFGLRRVLVLLLALLVIGVGIALKTVGGIASARR